MMLRTRKEFFFNRPKRNMFHEGRRSRNKITTAETESRLYEARTPEEQ